MLSHVVHSNKLDTIKYEKYQYQEKSTIRTCVMSEELSF